MVRYLYRMKQSMMSLLVIALSLTLILLVTANYIFSRIAASGDNIGQQSDDGATLREHHLIDLASKISLMQQKQEITSDQWPTEWQQIGTGRVDCSLNTKHCQISNDHCLDLTQYLDKKISLPIDTPRDTAEHTGFAIKKENDTLYMIACFGEEEVPQEKQLRLK